jgi:hypothetical protein
MAITDDAITRLQVLALSSAKMKAAPYYPVASATMLPLAIAYVASGNLTAVNATDAKLIFNINVDIHFPENDLTSLYKMIYEFIPDYLKRLAGDPTLNTKVSTIVYPVTFSYVGGVEYNTVKTQLMQFVVPIKFALQTPTVTA